MDEEKEKIVNKYFLEIEQVSNLTVSEFEYFLNDRRKLSNLEVLIKFVTIKVCCEKSIENLLNLFSKEEHDYKELELIKELTERILKETIGNAVVKSK